MMALGSLRPWPLLTMCAALLALSSPVNAQQSVQRRIALARDASIKVWVPAGSIRVIGWDRDSLVVEGSIGAWDTFYFGGGGSAAKFGLDDPPKGGEHQPARLVAYVPRGATVSVRTVSASIEGTDVSGWFNTVGGNIDISGSAREVQVEAMDGSISLSVAAPYARARTGSGTLSVAGRVEDLGVASVSGPITVTSQGIGRGRIESVTGAIVFSAPLDGGPAIDIDNHGGSVELRLASNVAADFELTSVAGSITNFFDGRLPTTGRKGRGQELAFTTDPKGAQVIVRTFKAPITLRKR